MAHEQEQNTAGKVLKVFRLETQAEVSVSELGLRVQSIHAEFIPLSGEAELASVFRSAGLMPTQVEYALKKLKGTARNEGFLVHIDQGQPSR